MGRLGGLRSEKLGEFGSRIELGLGNSEGWGRLGSEVWFERLGSGGLGLARKIGIRGVGVEGELESGRSWGRGEIGVGGIGVRKVIIAEVEVRGVGVKEVGNVISPPDLDSFDPKSPNPP